MRRGFIVAPWFRTTLLKNWKMVGTLLPSTFRSPNREDMSITRRNCIISGNYFLVEVIALKLL